MGSNLLVSVPMPAQLSCKAQNSFIFHIHDVVFTRLELKLEDKASCAGGVVTFGALQDFNELHGKEARHFILLQGQFF